jgi:hypothetical protein
VVELFASGRIVDCIAGLMLLEFIALSLASTKAAHGIKPIELGVSLGAGMALLFALRAALLGLEWQLVSMWLILALIAHVLYLKLRWNAE